MKCIVCKQEDTQPGTTTLSIDKGETIVVIRNVPAEICALCGEEYIALIL
ncbi:MAG: type II toxin-antitoxin system MqsA family antitoxin [Pseudomonadota bacterium]|nr:type II toxin-antitoxin system MqsA family antitoxin [Pseudomonadota bacterium]